MLRWFALSLMVLGLCQCLGRLAADDAPPRKVALLVGVNKYLKPGFKALEFCEEDVQAIGAELQKLGFEVTILLGSTTGERQATRANIEAAARRMVAPLTTADLALVMLSGHGQQLDPNPGAAPAADPNATLLDKSTSYFCPVDAVADEPATQFAISLLTDEILAKNVGTRLVVVDACRDVPPQSKSARKSQGIQGRTISLPEDTGVFFSCRAGQFSYVGNALGHSLFSYCLLDGLRGNAARDGELAWADLVAHVNRRMAQPDMKQFMLPALPQVPIPAGAVPHTVLGKLVVKSVPPVAKPMPTPETPPPATSPKVTAGRIAITTLTDGRALRGEVTAEDGTSLTLKTTTGVTKIAKADVEELKYEPSPVPPAEPAVTKGIEGTVAGEVREFSDLKIKMCWCPAGSFTMGSPSAETGRKYDEEQVAVTLSRGFWLGQTEVTQGLWHSVMGTTPWVEHGNTDLYKAGANYPAVYVNWDEMSEFCRKLTARDRAAGSLPSGWVYTLPTEAQWEYACRAETTTPYNGDGTGVLGDYAWYTVNADDINEDYAHAVGQKKPNRWRLLDMHGNVFESCQDWYRVELPGGRDPLVSSGGSNSNRVCRSGCWGDSAGLCRSAQRGGGAPSIRNYGLGFRVALCPTASPTSSPEGFTTTSSGLNYRIVRPGSAKKPNATDIVSCHYKGWLDNGTVFDSSYDRGEPTELPLNGVIEGWTEGLQLIGEGGEIELQVPSNLGYGDRGLPPTIPGGATLHFKVELLKVL